MNDYQISNDGTIFHIKEDGSISKLGKIENDRIVGINNVPSSNTSFVGAIFFFWVSLFAILLLGIFLIQSKNDYDDLRKESSLTISFLESRISSMESELSELSDFKNNVGTTIPLVITNIEIGNTDGNGNIETNFGYPIYSNRTMFLTPKIRYVGFSSGTRTLNVKLFRPDGKISTGESSPPGYSFSCSDYISRGQHSLQLDGWGKRTKGNWPAGTYKIEIWYEKFCLQTKTFTIIDN